MNNSRSDWRNEGWDYLKSHKNEKWDIVIVGGGITGAGIFLEASRLGLKVLLVEGRDFAWGCSSRSSKLVHGGLRYLKQGNPLLTRHSVTEREHLLKEAAGLVTPLNFLLPVYKGEHSSRFLYGLGLAVYDLIAMHWNHKYLNKSTFVKWFPNIDTDNLSGGYLYQDAQVDDARLVYRVIQEARELGGMALNYVRVEDIIRHKDYVTGATLCEANSGERLEIVSPLIVNATGIWSNTLCRKSPVSLRAVRGSHLVFPADRLAVDNAITYIHPRDDRMVFAIPWEGTTIVGTTDVDHGVAGYSEVSMSQQEVEYLLEIVNAKFPGLHLRKSDIQSGFSGIRSIISSGKSDPSKESRDHQIWDDGGLLSITGGKLTTFRKMALDLLKHARPYLHGSVGGLKRDIIFHKPHPKGFSGIDLSPDIEDRLLGRYGDNSYELLNMSEQGDLDLIPGTHTTWAEIKWAALSESVNHLDDILLRRVRVGLLLAETGHHILPRVRTLCQKALGWPDERWLQEEKAYKHIIDTYYSVK
ncbi:MAG: glycerol-3-phosphate dehydrogenase/oxidase [Spirochaetota bacterium]|nr:glycerol-3-phosphate dehydrogenase/oxidase [Spirochaetota bacterium]